MKSKNATLWTDKSYILKKLGVPAMQDLLCEERSSLSPKKTELLKQRFRRRFKPTDGAVLNRLLEKCSDGDMLQHIPERMPPSTQASQMPTSSRGGHVETNQESLRITAHNNRRIWKGNTHILQELGVSTMQNLLGEKQKMLSLKETYALKKRFRGHFKPTDDKIVTMLVKIRKDHSTRFQAYPPMQSSLNESKTVSTNQNLHVSNIDESSCVSDHNKPRRLNDKSNVSNEEGVQTVPQMLSAEGMCIPSVKKLRRLNDKTSCGPAGTLEESPYIFDPDSRLQLESLIREVRQEIHDWNRSVNVQLQQQIQHWSRYVEKELKIDLQHLSNQVEELRAIMHANAGCTLRSIPKDATPDSTAAASLLMSLAGER